MLSLIDSNMKFTQKQQQYSKISTNQIKQMTILYILLILPCLSMHVSFQSYAQALIKDGLDQIERKIQTLTKQRHQPKYNLYKLEHTGLSTEQQSTQCLSGAKREKYELIPSISIYEGESVSYPAIVKHCDTYYSLKGHPIAGFELNPVSTLNYRHFISSVRSQFTYFAEVQWGDVGHQNSTVAIKKLQQNNRKTILSQQSIIQIPLLYGRITGFANSFSLSLKLLAFSTDLGKLLFYRMDGRLESCIDLLLYHTIQQHLINEGELEQHTLDIRITKLNNHIAIYTSTFNWRSFVFTVSTNGRNSTLRRFALPKLETAVLNSAIVLKYNDNNWNQFFIKIHRRVYAYQIKSSSAPQSPITNSFNAPPSLWYSLMTEEDQFYIAGSLLIIQSKAKSSQKIFWFYYNLTDGASYPFILPNPLCQNQLPQLSVSSQTLGSHIICVFCSIQYECYSILSSGDPNANKMDYTDYSKFRVPLVLLSLGIVIFISVTGKKSQSKSMSEEKQQQLFLKELERKDKALYDQLNKRRKDNTNSSLKEPRVRGGDQFNKSYSDSQNNQRMGNSKIKYN